jgi:hypothetical protein
MERQNRDGLWRGGSKNMNFTSFGIRHDSPAAQNMKALF